MNHRELEEYRDDLRSRIVRNETIVERVENQVTKHNNRTGNLENWRSWIIGSMAGLGLVITLIRIGVL